MCIRDSAEVAQSVEHSTENAGVTGSIPVLGTIPLQLPASGFQRSALSLSASSRGGSWSRHGMQKASAPLFTTVKARSRLLLLPSRFAPRNLRALLTGFA